MGWDLPGDCGDFIASVPGLLARGRVASTGVDASAELCPVTALTSSEFRAFRFPWATFAGILVGKGSSSRIAGTPPARLPSDRFDPIAAPWVTISSPPRRPTSRFTEGDSSA
jgi:hypothetical protein